MLNKHIFLILNTLGLVGVNAFNSMSALESIEVYKAKDGNYETFYFSQNGVLFRYDAPSASTYLEFFPRAKTGEYTVPSTIKVGEQ